MIPDTQTDRLFTGLAAALAAVESGIIEEAEVEGRTILGDDTEQWVTITVRRRLRHPSQDKE